MIQHIRTRAIEFIYGAEIHRAFALRGRGAYKSMPEPVVNARICSTMAHLGAPRYRHAMFGRKEMVSARRLVGIVAALALTFAASARAEVAEVSIAFGPGITFLPLVIVKQLHLLEKHAAASGLADLKANWVYITGASTTNDGILSGRLQIAASGVPGFLQMWSRTAGSPNAVAAIAAVTSLPQYLNTDDPAVHTIADFKSSDRIALPAVKVSSQAIFLEMAAASAFGMENYAKLDPMTVSMAHPDAMAAMLSGAGGITAHFTSPPFQYLELRKPQMHRVLSSYDVMGGPATLIVAWCTRRFHDENPRTSAAFLGALDDAMTIIAKDRRQAAELYIQSSGDKTPVDDIIAMIGDPQAEYTTTPKGIAKYTEFLGRTGALKTRPAKWQDLFFDLGSRQGS
jgi:NitT/TauT family transport system substrate-binding protein